MQSAETLIESSNRSGAMEALKSLNVETTHRLMDSTTDDLVQMVDIGREQVLGLASARNPFEAMSLQAAYMRRYAEAAMQGAQKRREIWESAMRSGAEIFNGARKDVAQKAHLAVVAAKEEIEDQIDEHLEQIEGVGETYAERLREAGVVSVAQLAAINTADLMDESHPLHDLKGRMETDQWVEQAREMLAGSS